MSIENEYRPRVNIEEALRYLGFRPGSGELCSESTDQVKRAASLIENVCEARSTSMIFETEAGKDPDSPVLCRVKGHSEPLIGLPGKDIRTLLAGCTGCIIFAATIGQQVDALIRRTQITDMAKAVIMDACASSAIEDLCNNIEAGFAERYLADGFFLTDRFSPGYGDMSIELQKKLCHVLETGKLIGLTVLPSFLMMPTKSVTAIIGISSESQPRRITGCAHCSLAGKCRFRKEGTTCEL